MNIKKRILSLLLAAVMALTFLPQGASAATNPFEKTDNISQNMINAALANIGKKNGDFPDMPHDQWCAYFICWLAQVSGATDQGLLSGKYSASGTTGSVARYAVSHRTGTFTALWDTAYDYLVSKCGASNLIQKGNNSTYTPRAGDIVFFHWKNGTANFASHVGLVYNVTGSKIEYVDGNGVSGTWATTYVSTHSLSRASSELSGYLRLNTEGGTNTNTGSVSFSLPTQSAYVSRQQVTETNAVLVNQIVKPSGTRVTQMGIYLYDASGNLLKRYAENTSNVPASQTLYHSWFDVNAELGLRLTPGTSYQYAMFGIFDGGEQKGPTFSFTTKGSAPVTAPAASFSPATEAEYKNKESVTETNAVVVNQVNKNAGVSVTQTGLYLYGGDGQLIKRHIETTSNVPASQTRYHSWFDINRELGVRLTPGTTYRYQFFGIFNGAEIKGGTYSFTTLGATPAPVSCSVAFNANGGFVSEDSRIVTKDASIGTLPVPTRQGYTFQGWFTAPIGGAQVFAESPVQADTALYAQWAVIEPEKYTVTLIYDVGGARQETMTVSGTELPALPTAEREGYTFQGWFTAPIGGTRVFAGSPIQADTTLYAQWAVAEPEKCTVTLVYREDGSWKETRVVSAGAAPELPQPERAGYTFEGWFTGQTGGVRFLPTDTVSGDMTLYARWTEKPSAPAVSFTDVGPDDWFAKPVQWAVENKITSGTSASTFSPNKTCTRAEAIMFLWNAAGRPQAGSEASFRDVPEKAWYGKALSWAVENKITSGTSADTFSPNKTCTRAETIMFLWNAAGKPQAGSQASFQDVPEKAWYGKALGWAVANHITGGTGKDTFSPNKICTRAQIVTFLKSAQALRAG